MVEGGSPTRAGSAKLAQQKVGRIRGCSGFPLGSLSLEELLAEELEIMGITVVVSSR